MLLAESQKDLATAIRDWFLQEHFTVDVVNDGSQALDCLHRSIYDVIMLELVLSNTSGIDVIRSYRTAGGSSPILLIADRRSADELESGLDAGADIFVVKPFQLRDLAAQVRALLRRPALRAGKVLLIGGIAVNTATGTVTKDDKIIHLYPMELKLLEFLLKHPDELFSQEALSERIWIDNDNRLSVDTVRTHIKTLRHKIDTIGCDSLITTVRGSGYRVNSA
jgi:DNA-binding response OmpR family regulator